MRKCEQPIAPSLMLLAMTIVANDVKAQDINWGQPSPIADHVGEVFQVTNSNGPKGSLKFPTSVTRDDGSVVYTLQVEFQAAHLKFTNHCTYRGKSGEILTELSTPLAAVGEQIANGYVISHTQKTETEQAGKPCGMEITDSTYLLMKNKNALRLYVDPDNFFELSLIK